MALSDTFDFQMFSFVTLGILSLICAGVMATRKVMVSAAMMLICMFVCMAGMYGILDAHFAAVAQILVYAGAIMVVFLFVIMLLNLPPDEIKFGKITAFESVLALFAIVSAVGIGQGIATAGLADKFQTLSLSTSNTLPFPESENVKNVAVTMFTQYLWAFEVVSFVILLATIGAVVISKKRGSHADAT
jgi:NADH-quinone oxidoreductase subunit J